MGNNGGATPGGGRVAHSLHGDLPLMRIDASLERAAEVATHGRRIGSALRFLLGAYF